VNDNLISIDDFAKIGMRVGTIIDCSAVEGSDKLLKETVDFGPEIGTKIILSGLRKWYNPESLIGKQGIFVVNLPARKMMGIYESEGMIMVAENGEKLVILKPAKKMPNGARIR
jgi:methionyl-tRNA synthetase